jgi:hypothetical protein
MRALATVLVATSMFAPAVHAGDMPMELILIDITPSPPLRDRMFTFSGGDLGRDSRFVWAGLVGALGGRLRDDGPRLRVMGGAGRYRYRTDAAPDGVNDVLLFSGEFLLGYRRAFGPAEATVYLGPHTEGHWLTWLDPSHRTQGVTTGVKTAVELYRRLSDEWYVTLSASASTVHRRYHARTALAHEFPKAFTLGIETAVHGDARYAEPRVGLFAQTAHRRTVLRLSGGYLSNSDKGRGPYATLSVYVPY